MTNKKAAALLTQIFNTYGIKMSENYKDGIVKTAFEMAIDALRAEQIKDGSQTDYVLSKDSEAYKFNKHMEVEEMWLNEQIGKE